MASLNKAFSQYYSMAKETWIQVGHGFVSFRRSGGWKGVVFFESTLKVVNRWFFLTWSLSWFDQITVR